MKLRSPAEGATRPYRMQARAASTAATRRAIVDGALELFVERAYATITLDLVAERAGVTTQTVIRHFGSRDGLFAAMSEAVVAEETPIRAATPAGDVALAVRDLVGRYERIGDVILQLLAQEGGLPALAEAAETGRRMHHTWVDRVFAPFLEPLGGAVGRRRRAQLIALTDIYVWKVLRRDLGLSRRRTEEAIAETISSTLTVAA